MRSLSPDDFANLAPLGLRMEERAIVAGDTKVRANVLHVTDSTLLMQAFGPEKVTELLQGSQSLPTECANRIRNKVARERLTATSNVRWLCDTFNGTKSARGGTTKHIFRVNRVSYYTLNSDAVESILEMVDSGATIEEIRAAGFAVSPLAQ